MLSKYPTIQDALERAERRAQDLPHVAQVKESDWDVVVLANEVKRLQSEVNRLTPKKPHIEQPIPYTVPPYHINMHQCSVCGMKSEGAMGYVCPRADCPTAITCNNVKYKFMD